MANQLAIASAWLTAQQAEHAASPATYRRRSTTKAVRATAGETRVMVGPEGAAAVEVRVADFIIPAADLGALAPPQRGDLITLDNAAGGSDTFEVMELAGDGAYRRADPEGTAYRVHTKKVG